VELTDKERSILRDLVDREYTATEWQLREAYDNPNMRFYFNERLDALDKLREKLGGDSDHQA